MIETKEATTSTVKVIACICDMCHKRVVPGDYIEFQEMIHIRKDCGYGSVFGDGATLNLDICQHCLKKWLDKMEVEE